MSEPFVADLAELLRKHGVENAPELARYMYASLSHLVVAMRDITEANRARAAAAAESAKGQKPPAFD